MGAGCRRWVNGVMGVLLAAVTAAALAGSALAADGYVTSFDGTKIVYSFFPDPALTAGQTAPTVMFGPGYSQRAGRQFGRDGAARCWPRVTTC